MRDSLGLSVGATNLVAARADGSATVRPAAVAWRGGLLTGFVERVADPIPIVAPDGSTHPAERLLNHALAELVSAGGGSGRGTTMAVPAHWREPVVARMRAMRPDVEVVSDATAALTALRARPGLPARGLVMLCDFGASGTSLTLADAANDFQPVAPTTRYDEFSGELIDRLVLAHLLSEHDVDATNTSAVASLAAFRDHCRAAKERLSQQTATGLPGPIPGSTMRLTRTELDALLEQPFGGLLDAIDDTLRRAGVPPSGLAAVATVGGGARIPYVTQQLSQALRTAVTTTADAQTVAAIGAALLAARVPEPVTRVGMAPQTGTLLAAAVPMPEPEPEPAVALAWSEEPAGAELSSMAEPPPMAEPSYQDHEWARPALDYLPHDVDGGEQPALPWYQRPALLFAGAACAVVLASAGLFVTTHGSAATAAATAPLVSAPTTSQPPSSAPMATPMAVAPAPAPVDTQPVSGAPDVVTYPQAPPVQPVPASNAPGADPQVPQGPAPEAPPPTSTTTTTSPTTSTPTTSPTSTPTTSTPVSTPPPTSSTPPPPPVSSTPVPPPSSAPPSSAPPSSAPPSSAPPSSAPPSSAPASAPASSAPASAPVTTSSAPPVAKAPHSDGASPAAGKASASG